MQQSRIKILGEPMNKITIICSNYNSDKWIDEYLEFINNQLDRNFDIIFIDANSKDQSLQKIKNFTRLTDIKTQIIECDKRIGIYEAWNIGIKASKTEYIMNYNTDDMIYKYAILLYNDYIKNFPSVDLFYSPCAFVKNRNIEDFAMYANWPNYSHSNMMKMCLCGPFPLVKKQVFEQIGYFDESFISSGDYEMWARMSKANCNFMKIPEIIGSFYHREDSIHASNASKAREEDLLIQNKYK